MVSAWKNKASQQKFMRKKASQDEDRTPPQIFNRTTRYECCCKSAEIPQQQEKQLKIYREKVLSLLKDVHGFHAVMSSLTHKAKMRARSSLLHLQIATLSMEEVLFTSSLLRTWGRSFLRSPSLSHFQPGTRFHTHLLRPNGLYCGQLRRYASSHNRLQSAPYPLLQMDVQVQTMPTNIGALQLSNACVCLCACILFLDLLLSIWISVFLGNSYI